MVSIDFSVCVGLAKKSFIVLLYTDDRWMTIKKYRKTFFGISKKEKKKGVFCLENERRTAAESHLLHSIEIEEERKRICIIEQCLQKSAGRSGPALGKEVASLRQTERRDSRNKYEDTRSD